MPNITVSIDESLKERMDDHPEINWSEVARQAFREKIRNPEVMEEIVEDSELTDEDVEELAGRIDQAATAQAMDDLDDQADT